jgi:hypothetical protein
MRFSEVLWEVARSDGFVDGHYELMVRSWRLSWWVLAKKEQLQGTEKDLRSFKRWLKSCMKELDSSEL